MPDADGKVVYEVRADSSKVSSDLDGVGRDIEKHSSKWDSVLTGMGHSVGSAVIGMAKDAAVAVYELGTAFEDGMAKASTLVDTSTVDMNALGDSLLELSSKYGLEASSLAESTYNAISANNALGEDTEGLMSLLESSAKLAKAGFADLDTATSATLKTLNAYGLGVEEADRIQKILIQTQNTGITTVGELGGVLSQVTPSAAAVGISFEEVGAAIATMTAQGVPAAQATTQLNAVITAFLNPTDQMKSGLSQIADEMIRNGQITGENAEVYKHYQARLEELGHEILKTNVETAEGSKEYEELRKAIKEVNKDLEDTAAEMSIQILQSAGLQGSLEKLNDAFGGSSTQMAAALSSSEALKASLAITGENAGTFTSNLEAMSTETDVVGAGFDKVAGTSSEKLNRSLTTLKNTGIQLWRAISPIVTVLLDLANTILGTVVNALSGLISWISGAANAVSRFFSALLGTGDGKKRNSHAVGADYIPYDGYPAVLHQGEAVLTASEARVWRAGGNTRAAGIGAPGGGTSIDYGKLAQAMSGLTVVMDGKAVGQLVEPSVSDVQARKLESMQRSGFHG